MILAPARLRGELAGGADGRRDAGSRSTTWRADRHVRRAWSSPPPRPLPTPPRSPPWRRRSRTCARRSSAPSKSASRCRTRRSRSRSRTSGSAAASPAPGCGPRRTPAAAPAGRCASSSMPRAPARPNRASARGSGRRTPSVRLRTRYARATRTLGPGTIVGPADVAAVAGDPGRVPLQPLPQADALVGARLRRTIAAGAAIAGDAVTAAPLVRSGDEVATIDPRRPGRRAGPRHRARGRRARRDRPPPDRETAAARTRPRRRRSRDHPMMNVLHVSLAVACVLAVAPIAGAADKASDKPADKKPGAPATPPPSDVYDVLYARYLESARRTPAGAGGRPVDRLDLEPRRSIAAPAAINDLVTIRVVESIEGAGTADSALDKNSKAARRRDPDVRRREEAAVGDRSDQPRGRVVGHAVQGQRRHVAQRHAVGDDHRARRRSAAERRPRARRRARDRHQRRPPDRGADRRRPAARHQRPATSSCRRRSASCGSATSAAA